MLREEIDGFESECGDLKSTMDSLKAVWHDCDTPVRFFSSLQIASYGSGTYNLNITTEVDQ